MVEEIPLSRPDITDAEVHAVTAVLRSGRLSQGPAIATFESMLAQRTGRRHAVACSSGTAGLHMALLALGIGPGDEVVTTPFSFIASSNAILYVGARPVFVDIDSRSMNMDPAAVEAAITPRTKAILAVETFGNPAHFPEYRSIANRHEIKLVEDCCEGLGGRHRDRPIGSFGHVGVFGFYPNKQITTGEGGCVVTDDERVADVMRSLRNQGRPVATGAAATGSWMAFERLGYNYRLPDVNAAIGVAQMNRLDEILRKRQDVAQHYMSRLMDNADLVLPTVDPHTVMSWFVFVVRLGERFSSEERDRIIAGLHRHEVGASQYFPCIHLQPHYRDRFGYKGGEFPVAERISGRTIALPFYNQLSRRDVDYVSQTLALMMSRENLKRT